MEPCGACCGQALRLALAAPRRHIDGTIRFRCSDRGMGDDRSWPATLYHIWIIAHCRFRVSACRACSRGVADRLHHRLFRSEEHTSELQSLMRISYAVLCSTKNNTPHIHTISHIYNRLTSHLN